MAASYIVSWDNQYGTQEYRRFSLEQASRMAVTIYSRPDAYGEVTNVSIILSDEPLDERSIEEIEGQVIA
jgi:hypothetical protein